MLFLSLKLSLRTFSKTVCQLFEIDGEDLVVDVARVSGVNDPDEARL